jgi:hypothetical protein
MSSSDSPADAKLLAPRGKVLSGIFEDGRNVELSDLENDFYHLRDQKWHLFG